MSKLEKACIKLSEDMDQFRAMIAPYYKSCAKHNGNEYLASINMGELEFTKGGVYCCTEEYNTACNCHPEFETSEYFISFEDMRLTPEEFEKKVLEAAELKRQKKEQEKQERQFKENQEIEKQEKEQWLRLQKKFGEEGENCDD